MSADLLGVELRIIVNCGPCEAWVGECIRSIRAQTYPRWRAVVSVDPWEDATFPRALEASRGEPRIDLVRNPERRYAMENLVRAIERSAAAPGDVIVVLDGDDWFCTRDALRTIADAYRDPDCWLTYGSWLSNAPAMPGLWPAYAEGTTNFRQVRWLATAVRTFKRWLWDRVDERDFRDDGGRYFRVTEDMASMFPMLEMSGTRRARHIDRPLMRYNNANPANAVRVWREEVRRNSRLIRGRPPYRELEGECGPA